MEFKDFAQMYSHLESVNQIILDAIGKWSTQEYAYSGIQQGDLTTFIYLVNICRDPFRTTGLKTLSLKVPLEFFEKGIDEVREIINKIPKRKLLIKGHVLDIKGLLEENV
jgi:hypothetical protein